MLSLFKLIFFVILDFIFFKFGITLKVSMAAALNNSFNVDASIKNPTSAV